jgi:hypothetical protein
MHLMENSPLDIDSVSTSSAASIDAAAAPSIVPELPSITPADSILAVDLESFPILRAPRRSMARRITERLILGVAALALYGTWVLIPDESPRATISPALRGTTGSPEVNSPTETTGAITTAASNPSPPSWFSPDILYVPSWTPPASSPARAEAPSSVAMPIRRSIQR